MTRYFTPATIAHDGPYARACRHLSRAVRAHLSRFFFTTERVRSSVPTEEQE